MYHMLGGHYILSSIDCHTTTGNLARSFLPLDFQFSSSTSNTGAPLWTPVGAVLSSSLRRRAQLPANTIIRRYVGHSEKEHFLRKKLQKAVVWNTAMPKNITVALDIIIRWYVSHSDHLVFENYFLWKTWHFHLKGWNAKNACFPLMSCIRNWN